MICVEIGAAEMWTTEHSIETNVALFESVNRGLAYVRRGQHDCDDST